MLKPGVPSDGDGHGRKLRGGTIVQRMELQEIIQELGEVGIRQYLRGSHGESDFNHLRERLLAGDTVKEAARTVAKARVTQRSYHTLLYHARDIRRVILEELGTPTPSLVKELLQQGTVSVGLDRAPDMRQALDEQGLRVVEEIRFTLVGREDR